jgi:hypothetical protein
MRRYRTLQLLTVFLVFLVIMAGCQRPQRCA